MSKAAFGNDPAKIERYISFWKREDVKRPLVGFTFIGWFPFGEFMACKAWSSSRYLTPEMIAPQAFMDDYIRLLREGETLDDDLIRGACPMQVKISLDSGSYLLTVLVARRDSRPVVALDPRRFPPMGF